MIPIQIFKMGKKCQNRRCPLETASARQNSISWVRCFSLLNYQPAKSHAGSQTIC